MAPPGRFYQIVDFIAPRGAPQILRNADPFMKGSPKNIEIIEIFDDAILDVFGIGFRFIGSEYLVPDDENTGIISVEIARVGRMMNAVVRWRVHHRLEPARHPVDRFGMNPILVNQIQPHEEEYQRRWEAEEKQWQPKDEADGQKPGPGLSQRSGEIIVLAAVMGDMGRPEPPDPVSRSVEPVISQIIEDKRQRHEPQGVGPTDLDIENSILVSPQAERQNDSAGQQASNHTAGAQRQRGKSIFGLVADVLVFAAPPPFHSDRYDKKRHGPVGW